ncbi:hypothetical protein HIM_04754 [Hirsutella minnesotensis 3608]|uniref:Annexin n=1 Tax=Hirsutella minnesotensis 3608 TaxID=1043627 RepID=A0A0F7ZPQ9_9HYPO|nr:hypothetical protein HIM_04754 [Hirsutella minnesotensis 3608]
MSLLVDDNRRGGRSRSRSRDRRPRDEPERQSVPKFADVREPSYVYPEDDVDSAYRSGRYAEPAYSTGGLPYPAESALGGLLPGSQALYSYDDREPVHRNASPSHDAPYRSSKTKLDSHLPGSFPEENRLRRGDEDERRSRYADVRNSKYGGRDRSDDDEPRVRYAEPPKEKHGWSGLSDDMLKLLPQKYSRKYGDGTEERDDDRKNDRRSKKERDQDDLAYGKPPPPPRSPRPESPLPPTGYSSSSRPNEKRSSQYGRDEYDDRRRPGLTDDVYGSKRSHRDSYREDPRGSSANVLTVEPTDRERDRRRDKSPGPSALAVEPGRRDRERSRDGRGSVRDRSPNPPTARMSTLSVNTGRSSNLSLAAAPASPLLESYHGTYQNCSPMPSPLLLASQGPSHDPRVIEALSPLNSDVEGEGRKAGRRARFHDPEDIASTIAQALKGDRAPDTKPLIEILPSLSHEQVMELRTEYKRLVKTGSDRKGVNVAKHIRARLKDEDPNLMKACYSVALGRWESEAYWANFWYQGDKTRRELLIESLMGRSNYEIHKIKEAFTDKKYDNSLVKCMKTELKEDKFKKAVLAVLDERRMEDFDSHGRRLPLDYDLVDQDVDDLRRALKADKGGESAMITIVVKRSDGHLRAVLKEYEHHYRANFAREALKKSGNLVGELLAHILNGVINRPVRDALLLHHALSASRKDDLRRELLISRLVRFHWDPAHMQAVKRAYRERYGRDVQEAVREATSGQWGRFCAELCIARMPNDVRRMENH